NWWLAYLAIGAAVAFAAGSLGIGGGMIMVPMLVPVLTAQGFPQDPTLHVAMATAMATIVFTSASRMRSHHSYGAVDWPIALALAPGMLTGAFSAALIAGFIPTRPLAVDRKSTRLNSSHVKISYAVFCLKKKKQNIH